METSFGLHVLYPYVCRVSVSNQNINITMAEVHILGELSGATGFEDASLFAKWRFSSGPNWRLLEGFSDGQTHLCAASDSQQDYDILANNGEFSDQDTTTFERSHHWSHPVDIHYATRGIHGWPKLELQAWGVDWLGKCNIAAYGFMAIPSVAGRHKLTCATWRPVGDLRRRLIDSLTGYRMHLVDPSDILSGGANRHAIQAQSVGTVWAEFSVILKGFEGFGLDI